MCRDGRSEEPLLERRAVRTLAARRKYQTALGTFLKFVQKLALLLVKDVEIDGGRVFERLLCPGSPASQWFAASCCRDGSLAVIQETFEVSSMFEGVAATHPCAHPTSNAGTSLGRHCRTTHPSQSSSYGSVHLHFADNVHASVRASGAEKEGSCPVFVYRVRSKMPNVNSATALPTRSAKRAVCKMSRNMIHAAQIAD